MLLRISIKENFIKRQFLGEEVFFNIMLGIVLFIVMAISAGMTWGG